MSEKYKLYSSKTTHLASSGNILATYNKSADVETPNQTEYSIYGSSRLGTQTYTAEELNEYEYSNTIQTIIEPITFRQNSIISINGVPFVGGNFSYNFQVDDEIVLSSGETFTLSSNFSTEYNNNILFITCDIIKTIGSENISSNNTKGRKTYELSNHLGNVMVTVSDKRKGYDKVDANGNVVLDANENPVYEDGIVDAYFADVTSAQDYYPFGMVQPGRVFNQQNYKYGYNTQERSDEIHPNHYTAKFWEYDSRIGRRWNIDPITYPWHSSYVVNNNNPIVFKDPLGLFGSRKEARQYKKGNNLKGNIKKDGDGLFTINNKKDGTSFVKDSRLEGFVGYQKDGVTKTVLVSADKKFKLNENLGAYVDGLGKFAKKGGLNTRSFRKKWIQKPVYDATQHLKKNYNIKIKPSTVTNGVADLYNPISNASKTVAKKTAKYAPLIGYGIDALEIYEGIQKDGNTVGANARIQIAGAVGGEVGTWGGAYVGALIGTALIPIPGLGTAIGAGVGAVVGSWVGENAVELGGEYLKKD